MDKLKFGNEGARQKERFKLPPMTGDYIDACCREAMRLLIPSGYLMLWADTPSITAHLVRWEWRSILLPLIEETGCENPRC
jgi:site-specific DNA-methyltransferase (adenine-specific)